MTSHRFTTIACDAEGCIQQLYGPGGAKDVRADAPHGWVYKYVVKVGWRDLCPEHNR